ncbi:phosphatase PAP2 family protein [Aureivirga sp. CE67]|uniref:phosphatase PAP2 family protein n=1 Tax=Aureivirga sp. CE67 TaxID=1788983 RepID=UPI0018CA7A69|nr:phosphatase PAP2 family protein [Aureivirga sp. CE67]
MFDSILQLDRKILIFLNNLGNENWDAFWLFITNQKHWIPFILLLLVLIWVKTNWKYALVVLLVGGALGGVSNEIVDLFKETIQRLRPNNDESIKHLIRVLKNPRSFSFLSGHATTSTALSMYLFLHLRKYYKFAILAFIWPLLFAYSRIYLGVHYPTDITVGMLFGIVFGISFYKLSKYIIEKKIKKVK